MPKKVNAAVNVCEHHGKSLSTTRQKIVDITAELEVKFKFLTITGTLREIQT